MLNQREIIQRSVRNVLLIFEDVRQILRIVDDSMMKMGLSSTYGSVVTWDTSAKLEASSSWLYRWFARAYSRDDQPDIVVGLTINLDAEPTNCEALYTRLGVEVPAISVSKLKLDEPYQRWRPPRLVLDALWDAAWHADIRAHNAIQDRLIRFTVRIGDRTAEATTYYVDFLSLTSMSEVERLITEPMRRMWEGADDWVITHGIEAIELKERPQADVATTRDVAGTASME